MKEIAMIKERIQNIEKTLQDYSLCEPLQSAVWKNLPSDIKEVLISKGNKALETSWSSILACDYLDFSRTGNRKRFEDLYFSRRLKINDLILFYCIQQTEDTIDAVLSRKILDEILNGLMLLCEESGWQLPSHNSYIRDTPQLPFPNSKRPVIDLFAAETGALISCAYALLKKELDSIDEQIGKRIESELHTRIVEPYLNEHFWWMGSGDGEGDEPMCNWTPWCTQNILLVFFTLKLEEEKRFSALQKAAFSLDCFLKDYGEDGACCEGVQYYSHAGLCLFNAVEIINTVADGILDTVYKEKKIRNIAEFPYYMHVKNDIYFNFADCSPLALKPGVREYLFGEKVKSSVLCSLALENISKARAEDTVLANEINLFYRLQNISNISSIINKQQAIIEKEDKEKYYESCGIFIKSGAKFQTAVKAGNNGDSHNHNDTGSFIIYKNGKPVFIDIGVETYTAKTFSTSRYEIWTMQSAWHNLPSFSLEMQCDGADYCARNVQHSYGRSSFISMDISKAYKKSAGITSYVRRVDFEGDNKITIHDVFVPESSAAAQIQYPVLSLITHEEPKIREKDGLLTTEIQNAKVSIRCLPAERNLYYVESVPITDSRLQEAWTESVYRILLPFKKEIIIEIE